MTANAGDDVSVSGVQFRLDGTTSAPRTRRLRTPCMGHDERRQRIAHADRGRPRRRRATPTTSTRSTSRSRTPTQPAADRLDHLPRRAPRPSSGTIWVTANAADNVGVAGVQFRLDGANLGAEDTTSPYSVSWNTTAVANGSHTLTAVARDARRAARRPRLPVTVRSRTPDPTSRRPSRSPSPRAPRPSRARSR